MRFQGVLQFGSSDKVDTTPVNVAATTVTWTWEESREVPREAVNVVGYYIYYRKDTETPWIRGPDIAYTWTDWQVGRVTGLEPGTRCEFDISVYRRWWPGGEKFEHLNRANGNTVKPGPLTATTLAGIPDIPVEPQTTEHIQTGKTIHTPRVFFLYSPIDH